MSVAIGVLGVEYRDLQLSWNEQVLEFVCGFELEQVFEYLGYDDERLAARVHALLPVELQELNLRFRSAHLERKTRAQRAFAASVAELLLADLLRYPAR